MITAQELLSSKNPIHFISPNSKSVGSLQLTQVKKDLEYSLAEYLQGGIQINLNIGIDFTASNGNPSSSGSLHYFDPKKPDKLNQYQQAILAIGNILLNYDDDKLVPFLHFRFLPMDSELI